MLVPLNKCKILMGDSVTEECKCSFLGWIMLHCIVVCFNYAMLMIVAVALAMSPLKKRLSMGFSWLNKS
jgi:hypothetical protein